MSDLRQVWILLLYKCFSLKKSFLWAEDDPLKLDFLIFPLKATCSTLSPGVPRRLLHAFDRLCTNILCQERRNRDTDEWEFQSEPLKCLIFQRFRKHGGKEHINEVRRERTTVLLFSPRLSFEQSMAKLWALDPGAPLILAPPVSSLRPWVRYFNLSVPLLLHQ